MESAYAAIGRAVFAAQLFETAFIPIFELFKMQTTPGYLEETGGFVRAGAFKVPIKNVVKVLREQGNITADLESRLTAYVEDRHLFIHRWIQQNGWPADGDADGFAPIIELAARVQREAHDLTRMFVGYILKYANPDIQPGDFRNRVAKIFQLTQIEQ